MSIKDDIKFMNRAIELSKNGKGSVNPNPLVGAVIVKKGRIIGEGFHEYFGGPHAEINALNSASEDVKDSAIYVTLEPCNHFGKTPPCTDRIIKEKFSKVIVGMNDPNPLVNGMGIKKLEDSGIDVKTGILENDIEKLNEIYNKFTISKMPFCTIKTAMTLDGKISTFSGNSKWISNKKSREYVHDLRHQYSGIMVGVNTIIKDNPELTDRSNHIKKHHPVRIIVDSTGRLPINAKVLNTINARTIIAVTKNAGNEFINAINQKGAEVLLCQEKNKRVDLIHLFSELGKMNIDSILVEGGSTLNFSVLEGGIADKLLTFISPKLIGGIDSKTPVGGKGFDKISEAIKLRIENIERFEEDILVESYIEK